MAERGRSRIPVALLGVLAGLLIARTSEVSGAELASFDVVPRADPISTRGFFCLWKGAGFGHESFEQAAWIVHTPDGTTALIRWPSLRSSHRATWRGPIPSGALASVHTHPDRDDPRPSTADKDVAAHLGLPVVVLSRRGIFAAESDGSMTAWAGGDWFRRASERDPPCRP